MLRPRGEDMLAPLRRRVEPVSVAVANEAVELVIAVVHARARREAVTSLAELVPRAGELAEAVLALAVVVRAVSLGLPLRGGARRVGRAHAIVGVTRSNRLVVRARVASGEGCALAVGIGGQTCLFPFRLRALRAFDAFTVGGSSESHRLPLGVRARGSHGALAVAGRGRRSGFVLCVGACVEDSTPC